MPALMDSHSCKTSSSLHRQRQAVPVIPIIPRKLEKKPIRVVYRPSNSNSPAPVKDQIGLSRQVSPTRRGSLISTPTIEHNDSEEVVTDLASSPPKNRSLENGSREESKYFRLWYQSSP